MINIVRTACCGKIIFLNVCPFACIYLSQFSLRNKKKKRFSIFPETFCFKRIFFRLRASKKINLGNDDFLLVGNYRLSINIILVHRGGYLICFFKSIKIEKTANYDWAAFFDGSTKKCKILLSFCFSNKLLIKNGRERLT